MLRRRHRRPSASYLGLPAWLRLLAFALLAGSLALFIYSFRVLGRDNSYGAQQGLVTGGIYRWTRNPQNAMLVVVYGCLAVAADSGPTYVLCAAMMAVYTLMVLLEEPWLEGSLRRALPALLPPRAPLLQLAPRRHPGPHRLAPAPVAGVTATRDPPPANPVDPRCRHSWVAACGLSPNPRRCLRYARIIRRTT